MLVFANKTDVNGCMLEEEIQEVAETLRSGWITTGPRVHRFEEDFAAYLEAPYSVAVNSCTAAMHLALATIGVKAGDEVIVPTNTFTATAEVVVHLGARPVLVDCRRDTFNLNEQHLEEKATPRTSAIIPVHIAGQPCEMGSILEIARAHDIWTVEDAAFMLQAIAGHDPKDPTTSRAPVPDYSLSLKEDMRGVKVGLPRHYFFGPDPSVNSEVVSTVEKAVAALQELGAQVEEVSIPSLEHVRAANSVIMVTEAYAFHEPNLKSRPQDFGEIVRGRFRIGGLLKASDYLQAQRVRQWCRREFGDALRKVDLLVTPTMTQPAPAFEGYDPTSAILGRSFTAPFNVTGLPAISVPCGFTASGLPIGMQIAGRPFDEPGVIQAAYTYQQHAGWFHTRPPF